MWWTHLCAFLFGGTIVSGVRYLTVELHNPALAAVLALTPIGFICGYLVPQRRLLRRYILHLALVMAITVGVALLLHAALASDTLSPLGWLTLALIGWAGMQLLKYKFAGNDRV